MNKDDLIPYVLRTFRSAKGIDGTEAVFRFLGLGPELDAEIASRRARREARQSKCTHPNRLEYSRGCPDCGKRWGRGMLHLGADVGLRLHAVETIQARHVARARQDLPAPVTAEGQAMLERIRWSPNGVPRNLHGDETGGAETLLRSVDVADRAAACSLLRMMGVFAGARGGDNCDVSATAVTDEGRRWSF